MKKTILLSVVATSMLSSFSFADNVEVKSKAGVLKISGEHRLSYTVSDVDGDNGTFSVDRTYLQVKAYFFEDPKSYARVTFDAKGKDGTYEAYVKYSYLYLNGILPHTGVEIGQVHKPWVDYEEHYGFTKQAVYGVYADKFKVSSSADRGLNFKTKLDNFSSEVGIFQGEGYKDTPDWANEGYSIDARVTYHVFGTKDKSKYLNISLAGAFNSDHNDLGDGKYGDKNWALLHAVYKNSDFLVAGQYLNVFKDETASGDNKGYGYSLNADYYINPKVTLFGRYDYFKRDRNDDTSKNTIGGIAYKYNKNVTFALSAINHDNEKFKGTDDITNTQALVWVKW